MPTDRPTVFPSGGDAAEATLNLARDLVAIDTRFFNSNLPAAERIEQELGGFEVERLDYVDANGVAKRALVAHTGADRSGLALCGHMDTVPALGWETNPYDPKVADGAREG